MTLEVSETPEMAMRWPPGPCSNLGTTTFLVILFDDFLISVAHALCLCQAVPWWHPREITSMYLLPIYLLPIMYPSISYTSTVYVSINLPITYHLSKAYPSIIYLSIINLDIIYLSISLLIYPLIYNLSSIHPCLSSIHISSTYPLPIT